MSRTVIIDGDIVVYKTAEAIADSFEIDTDEDDEFIYRVIGWGNKQQAQEFMDEMIIRICKETKSDTCVICLSDRGKNFRKDLNPNYKGNRKKVIKPLLYDFLRDELTKFGYKVYVKERLEADDVIGILATSNIIKGDKVVWSLDKDFKTIPCKFRQETPNGTHVSKIITQEEADWNFMYQTLIGDKTDGYYGCKGVGDKTARKILGEIGENSCEKMWNLVKKTYKKYGLTEEDALMNARMARILRAEDYNFKTKTIKLWSS